MKLFNWLIVSVATVALAACVTINEDKDNNGGGGGGGGGTGASGVSSDKTAGNFTPQETESFCEWGTRKANENAGKTFDCGDGNEITPESTNTAECEQFLRAYPACDVVKLEGCFEILFADPCVVFAEQSPAACQELFECTSDENNSNNVGNNGNNTGNNGNNTGNNTNSEFCYDHDCNGDATGRQCFTTREDYCDSLCLETNCISVLACEQEC